MRSPGPFRLALISALVTGLAFATPVQAGDPPSPGAAEIGDRLFPGLGNGGYDVEHYKLDLRYETSRSAVCPRATASS